MKFILKLIGSFGFTGYAPIAPATAASFAFLVLYWFLPGGEKLAHPAIVAATLFLSVPLSTYLETLWGHDAGRIVIDEIAGLQVILVFAAPTALGVVAVFFLFRLFDIIKPFPARRSQNLPRGWGVVIDDVIAGLQVRIVLIVIALITPALGRFL